MENNELKILIDELRLLTKETDWVEFKSSTIKPNEKLGDYISGLSNAACIHHQPFAYLVLGIDNNNHHLTGTNYSFKTLKKGNRVRILGIRRYLTHLYALSISVCSLRQCIHLETIQNTCCVW